MGHTRERKPGSYDREIELDARDIADDFAQFVDDVHVMFLIHRSKDGALHKDRHLRVIVTRNKAEYIGALSEMLETRLHHPLGNEIRIYASVNSRNVKKAIGTFKHEQVDSEMSGVEDARFEFYLDVKSRFVSALMRPSNRLTGFFLFDVDDGLTLDNALSIFERSGFSDLIVKQYKTKNGWHIITKPFNYTKLVEQIPMQKDAILLLKY